MEEVTISDRLLHSVGLKIYQKYFSSSTAALHGRGIGSCEKGTRDGRERGRDDSRAVGPTHSQS